MLHSVAVWPMGGGSTDQRPSAVGGAPPPAPIGGCGAGATPLPVRRRREEGPERTEGVVGDEAFPDKAPQRVHRGAREATSHALVDGRKKRRPRAAEVGQHCALAVA